MSWKVTNRSHADAQLRFFSKDRQIIWPAPQKAYILRDGQTDVFDFECRRGERVCYGAWVKSNQSIFWGVGTRASNDCADCCTACGETPRSRYLDTTGAEPMSR